MNLAPQSCIESVSSFAEGNNVELSLTGLENAACNIFHSSFGV